MSNTQRLVFSFIEFLNSEIKSNSVSQDDCESLEVVIECLERVYNLSVTNSSDISKFHFEKPLKDIFENATKLQNTSDVHQKSPTDEDRIEAERLKSQGNELMQEGKYIDAISSYNKAIEYDWTNAVYLCNRAAAHSKLNEHEQAIEDCNEALKLDPNYGKVYGRMGFAYMAIEKYEDARDCFSKLSTTSSARSEPVSAMTGKEAIELEPTNQLYHSNLKTAEDKLNEQPSATSQPAGNLGGGNLFNSLFSNPGIMNMAQQFMTDPQMQNMMTNMMGAFGGMGPENPPGPETNNPTGPADYVPGGTVPEGTDPVPEGTDPVPEGTTPPQGTTAGATPNIFQFASQMAQQLQESNPDLVNNLRETMQNMSGNTNQPNETSKDESSDGKK